MQHAPLRIEMVVPALPVAGMEMMVARMMRVLAQRGHDVGVTCIESRGELGEQLAAEGHRVNVIPARGLATNIVAPDLEAWFRRLKPDVVHSHSGVWLKAVRAARRAGVAGCIHTVHGLLDREPFYSAFLKRTAALQTDVIAAVSQPLHEHLASDVGIERRRLQLITNGVDTDHFRPGSATGRLRKHFGIDDTRFVIGHVARLTPVKNQHLLIDAFAEMHRARRAAFLAIIGDGPLRSALESQIAQLGISGHVGFFGVTRNAAGVYREFDAFVLSSTAEGTSMSVLEAMATGLCVVATDVGGNSHLLDHGRAGVLVPSNNAFALASALTRVHDNGALRFEVGEEARTRAATVFSEHAMINAYEAAYRNTKTTRSECAASLAR